MGIRLGKGIPCKSGASGVQWNILQYRSSVDCKLLQMQRPRSAYTNTSPTPGRPNWICGFRWICCLSAMRDMIRWRASGNMKEEVSERKKRHLFFYSYKRTSKRSKSHWVGWEEERKPFCESCSMITPKEIWSYIKTRRIKTESLSSHRNDQLIILLMDSLPVSPVHYNITSPIQWKRGFLILPTIHNRCLSFISGRRSNASTL